MTDSILAKLEVALRQIKGVSALVLGGSRGRGTEGPTSDYDIGIYYEPDTPLNLAGLRAALAPIVDGNAPELSELGEWGPWIVGGGWLTIDGIEVDILYRDLARVRQIIAESCQGNFTMNYQVGHPHGFCSTIWMGEIDTCRPFFDPSGVIDDLKAQTQPYPDKLRQALTTRFGWEVGFAVENAALAARRGERTHIVGCAYRALCCAAQVLFAVNGRYLINEKGAVAEAASFPVTIPGLAEAQMDIWQKIGGGEHDVALSRLREVADSLQFVLVKAESRR